ncbi:hypothetical protein BJX70DRAFT_408261 [Aspergillus crustosus]
MWEPVTLPFRNDSIPLSQLPSTDEILACTDFLWNAFHKVVAVNDEIVVKYGGGINPAEGQALIYLERYVPQVPAPRLYAMYRENEQTFLIMQRVPGVQLDKVWSSLTESEKDDIISKLSPFQGEAAFVAGLAENFRALTERNQRPDYKVRFYETYLAHVLQGHRPTLTHGDVQQRNILVAENPERSNEQGERSFDVSIVDWEMAGWYPEFWEWFQSSSPLIFSYWEEDWCWRVQGFLQVYPAEIALMRMLDKDMGGIGV